MADKKDEQAASPAPARAPQTLEEIKSQRMVEVANEAAALNLNETVPGGRYKVGDIYVDAWGKEVK